MNEKVGQPDSGTSVQALLEPKFLDYAVHISQRHNYIYVVNPKVGCSSIIWTLQRLEAGKKDKLPPKVGTIHDRKDSPLQRPSDINASAQILKDHTYFKFTFVRNPFDRLMSCYLNKIARPTEQRKVILRLLERPQDEASPVSFAQFIDIIGRQTPIEMDPHWRTQWVQTLQDWVQYDAVGRFEHFDSELYRVGAHISPEFQSFVFSERRQATGKKPYHLITPKLAEAIREIYARDFVGFDYPFDLPSMK